MCLFSNLYLWGLNVDFACAAGRFDGFSYLLVCFAWALVLVFALCWCFGFCCLCWWFDFSCVIVELLFVVGLGFGLLCGVVVCYWLVVVGLRVALVVGIVVPFLWRLLIVLLP